jgi:CRP/FNR family cyclic AMP-dependent transcriptional regulator
MSDSAAQGEALDALRSVPLFAGFTPRQLRTIADSAAERRFQAGETIVKQGDAGIGFFLILHGTVEVLKSGTKVASLSAGQFFGEMALLDEQPRTAEVRATSDVRCSVLARWEFWGTVGTDPAAIKALLQETVRRLRTPAAGLTE